MADQRKRNGYAAGDRVHVAGSTNLLGPEHVGGPGTVTEVQPPRYTGGEEMLTVKLDADGDRKIGALFVERLR